MLPETTVAPARRELQEAFWTVVDREVARMTTALIEAGLREQQALAVGADWHQRSDARVGFRNGFYTRAITTPHGHLTIRVPRLREGRLDTSFVFDRYQRRHADIDRVLRHVFLTGASTRDAATLAEQLWGSSLSHQAVSRMTRVLDDALQAYRQGPIQPVYPVVQIDGLYVTVDGVKHVLMLVVGLREDGVRHVLDFSLGLGEDCRDLLWDLRRRGLEGVQLFVSDDAGTVESAVREVYPEVPWQTCVWHRLVRLWELLGPKDYRGPLVREAARIFRCASREVAGQVAQSWARRWQTWEPELVRWFMNGLEDGLSFHHLPQRWWPRARTTSLTERLIRTLRMRLNLMGAFANPHAALRALFGQLLRWHLVPRITQTT